MPDRLRIPYPFLALGVFVLGFLGACHLPAGDKVDEQFEKKVSFEFVDAPLEEVIYRMAGDLDVFIDRDSLIEEGIAIDEPINKTFENVPLKQVLTETLEPLGLVWSKVSGNGIKITTAVATDRDEVRFYDVFDLLASNQTPASQFLSSTLKSLQYLYREKDGGGAAALLRNGMLVVWQTPNGHEEVADYLRSLRKLKNLPEREADPAPIYTSLLLDEKSRDAFLALQTPVSIDYELAPMETHLARITRHVKLDYEVDEPDEEQTKKTLEYLKENCPFRVTGVPAIIALKRLLVDHGLEFILVEGKLYIRGSEFPDPDPQLFVKFEADSGWDAPSVADIIQDAVDKGRWQDIDGKGGTISQPLKDVLLIQNNIFALYQTLQVVDQLKRRPKSELAQRPIADRSAGKGRKAPDNDWVALEKDDRIVLRLQADRLPEIDEVVCYRVTIPAKEHSRDRGKLMEDLHPFGMSGEVRLKGKDATEIAELWRQVSFNRHDVPLLDIHWPEVGLQFRKEGRVISETTASWTTGTVLFKFASGKYERYGAALDKAPGKQLKDRLIRHQVFVQTYHEMWDAAREESKKDKSLP